MSTLLTKCSGDMFDTGFQKLVSSAAACVGKYLVLRRDTMLANGASVINVLELRVY